MFQPLGFEPNTLSPSYFQVMATVQLQMKARNKLANADRNTTRLNISQFKSRQNVHMVF